MKGIRLWLYAVLVRTLYKMLCRIYGKTWVNYKMQDVVERVRRERPAAEEEKVRSVLNRAIGSKVF